MGALLQVGGGLVAFSAGGCDDKQGFGTGVCLQQLRECRRCFYGRNLVRCHVETHGPLQDRAAAPLEADPRERTVVVADALVGCVGIFAECTLDEGLIA